MLAVDHASFPVFATRVMVTMIVCPPCSPLIPLHPFRVTLRQPRRPIPIPGEQISETTDDRFIRRGERFVDRNQEVDIEKFE